MILLFVIVITVAIIVITNPQVLLSNNNIYCYWYCQCDGYLIIAGAIIPYGIIVYSRYKQAGTARTARGDPPGPLVGATLAVCWAAADCT